jgi:hypothetical protein
LRIQEKPTSAKGRYGAVMVTIPNNDIGVDGCRLDHRYMGTNARGDERKGRLKRGDMS